MILLFQDRSLDRADRIQLYISYTLQIIIAAQVVLSLVRGNWLVLFQAVGTLLLTLMPAMIRRNIRVYLPIEFDLITVVFIFASLFLGEIRSYYERLWWWDLVLHTGSGIITGVMGFLLVYVLNREPRPRLSLSPVFVGLFSFAFAQAIGVLWEIFEFVMDLSFGLNMQKSGLRDTMGDLIVNTLGAALIAVGGYFYVRGGDTLLVDRAVRRFIERNARLYGDQKGSEARTR